jgi:hypothetical protein
MGAWTLVNLSGIFYLSRISVFPLCLCEFGLGEFDFMSGPLGRRQERRAVSSRRRRLSLTRASFPHDRPRPALVCPRLRSKHTLARLQVEFCEKMGPFLGGGMPPVVAPEGDLGFRGKPSCPLTLLTCCYLHFHCQLGCWACYLQQKTWKSWLRVEAT